MKKTLTYGALSIIIAGLILAVSLLMPAYQDQSAEASETPALTLGKLSPPPVQRCMNMGGALEAENEGDWGYTIRREDLARIKRAGFDTIRVPVKFSAHTSRRAPYKIDKAFLRRIDQIVDWAILEDIQIIIDVHHYEELMKNPYSHEKRLEAIWRQLGYHYEQAPDNLIFELINEPNDKMTIARTDDLNRRLLAIVRDRNPDRWVVIGSGGWGGLDGLLKSKPPIDPRVLTTFHYYDPFDFTHQGATWMPGKFPTGIKWSGSKGEIENLAKDMQRAADWRDDIGMPILLGEFGAITKADRASRSRWTSALRQQAESRDIGWCYWEWGTSFAAYDLSQEDWIPGMKKALTGR